MDKLIYEIAGKKYLLFSIPVTSNEAAQKAQNHVKRYGGITQGVTELKRGWFGGSATLNVLIPEEKAIQFSNDEVPH